MQLEDKVAVVTGAGRGIGRAIAVAYARHGAKVVCAARSMDELNAVAAQTGGVAVHCDVASETDIRALMDRTREQFGRIDILVNNAGAVARLAVHELPVEDWARPSQSRMAGALGMAADGPVFSPARRAFGAVAGWRGPKRRSGGCAPLSGRVSPVWRRAATPCGPVQWAESTSRSASRSRAA